MNHICKLILLVNVLIESILMVEIAEPYLQESQQLQMREGEKQYMLIKSNANLPQYGSCWTQAIKQLDEKCAQITDTAQATLALGFTKCFMDMSLDQSTELCELDDKECIKNLPERTFQAYTHFYTHTQNICFYLMHQLWHSETEETINMLRTHSQSVSKQLEMAGRLQLNLLQQQREGLKVQRQLVEHGLNLSEVLHESRGSLARLTADFKNSTIEHGRQLGDLFRRLSMLHNWFVGEYAFIEQILYYSMQIFVIMIFTTSKRTESSRFVLFLLTVVNLVVEFVLQSLQQTKSSEEDFHIKLSAHIWLIRKTVICIMVSIYVAMATLYVDVQSVTLNLLRTIEKQNNELLQILRNKNTMELVNENASIKTSNYDHRLSKTVDDEQMRIQNVHNWEKMSYTRAVQMKSIEEVTKPPQEDESKLGQLHDISVASRLRSRRQTPIKI